MPREPKRQPRSRDAAPAPRPAVDDQLRARARRQEVVATLGRVALESPEIQHLKDAVAHLVADALEVEFVGVFEPAGATDTLLLTAGAGWQKGRVGRERVPAAAGSLAGFTIAAGEPIVSLDLAAERRFATPPLLTAHAVTSGMALPIRGYPGPHGVLAAYTTRRREFSPDEVFFVRAVANTLAAAMQTQLTEQALRESEARNRAIVNTAVDAIVTIDQFGIMDSVNPAACRLFGYDAAELVGQNVKILMPNPYRRDHDQYLANYLNTGRAKIIGIGREVVGQRKDGTVFPMELAVSEFQLGARRMFAGVVHDLTERRRLEREIIDIGAAEQRRIGQDLHDGVCQQLAGVAFAMEVVGQKLTARSAPEADSLRKIAELVDGAITQARGLAHGLQPVTLQADGLAAALADFASKTQSVFRISCLFVTDGQVKVHDNTTATHLFRIAQEAVGNAIKHGKARTVVIDLGIADEQLRLSISDNGVGLDHSRGDGKGIGVQTMRYRASLIGGTLAVRPGDRGGTVVHCAVPLTSLGSAGEDRPTVEDRHGQAKTPPTRTGRTRGKPAAPAAGAVEKAGLRRRRSPDRP